MPFLERATNRRAFEVGAGPGRIVVGLHHLLIRFLPYSLTYSVPLSLERQCDRTLGRRLRLRRRLPHPEPVVAARRRRAAAHGGAVRCGHAAATALAGGDAEHDAGDDCQARCGHQPMMTSLVSP